MHKTKATGAALFLVGLCAGASLAQAEISVPLTYLKAAGERPPILSNLDPVPEDLGRAGALLGLADNQTTGSFMGHTYMLETVEIAPGGDVLAAARAALAASPFLLVDAAVDQVTAIADLPEAQGALIFNTASGADALRGEGCRANLLHTMPTVGMRADALMQFLLTRRWQRVAMIVGTHPGDLAYAGALRQSAAKFGIGIVGEKTWAFDADMRRNAAAEVPLFTQDFPEHDALLLADELHDFGRYVLYNAWLPRPVVGSEGLTAEAWTPSVEASGAVQLQNRFRELAGRGMLSEDWSAWAAIRAVGEAVTRTASADPGGVRDFLLSPDFELAGFKGRPLSFRAWNGQLRQPIPLTHPRALVALAPLEGFLHQRNELDTLGADAPESACTAFGD